MCRSDPVRSGPVRYVRTPTEMLLFDLRIFGSVRTNSNEISLLDLRIFVSVRTNSNRNFVVRFANFRPAFEFSCGSAKFLRKFG